MSSQSQSPFIQIDLTQLGTAADVLSVTEQAFQGYVNLRGRVSDSAFMTAAESVLGVALPTQNNTFVSQGDKTVLWYGPDEWLILTAADQQLALVDSFRSSLADIFHAVTDTSGGTTMLEVSGSAAREFLAKGSTLDLHPSVFTTGHCAQSVFAQAGMTLFQTNDAPVYHLIVRRSFSDYLGYWILDAAKEFTL